MLLIKLSDGSQLLIGQGAPRRVPAFVPGQGGPDTGSGTFFMPYDWWLADTQSDGTLRVGINTLPAGATDIEYRLDNGSWVSAGATSDFNITGLTDDQAYLVWIRPVISGSPGWHMLPKKGIPTATPTTTLYVDPTGGGDGSYGSPYSFSTALNAASAGDTIVLKDGLYGNIDINRGGTFSPHVIVTSENIYGARIDGYLRVSNMDGVTIKNVYSGLSGPPSGAYALQVSANAGDVTFENVKHRGIHGGDPLTWSVTDWQNNTTFYSAIVYSGAGNIAFRNCDFSMLSIGVACAGTSGVMEYCSIKDSRTDCVRLANNWTYRGNYIANEFLIDANHPDLMQGNSNTNVVIDGNILIEWEYGYDNVPAGITSVSQGIGVFDGANSNFTVTNNVIVCDSYHGVTIAGASNCDVSNNTLVHSQDANSIPSVNFTTSNQGDAPGAGNTAYNNICHGVTANGATVGSNTTHTYAEKDTLFPNNAEWDFRLAAGNANLTNGDAANDPATDIQGVTRDASTPARGAYETAY